VADGQSPFVVADYKQNFASFSPSRRCTGVGENIYLRGTILIYGLKYVPPGDKYDFSIRWAEDYLKLLVGMHRNNCSYPLKSAQNA
jgi:hypothetical protein